MASQRFALALVVLVALTAGMATASGDCNNAVCDQVLVPPNCTCNYVPEIYTPSDSCCPAYRCAPPPAADAVNCSALAPPPNCSCGFMPETASFADPANGQCCASYRCVRNPSVDLCTCATCPEPPPCACPGYEPVPAYQPTYKNGDCCPKKYKCRLVNATQFTNFQNATCPTLDEFFNDATVGCGGDCRYEARVLLEAAGKKDQCCPVLGCKPLRRPKCCSPAEVAACPSVNASCACPQLTRVVLREASPLDGQCCPVTDCVDLNNGVQPDCSPFTPLCSDSCKEAVVIKAANPLKGRCCAKMRCKKIKGCKNAYSPSRAAKRARRRRRRRRN